MKLDPYVLPDPIDEDLRGPAKKKKPKAKDEEDAEEESQPLPGADILPELDSDELPDFDIQGKLPAGEDSPPSLPVSLKQVVQTQHSESEAYIPIERNLDHESSQPQQLKHDRLINPASAAIQQVNADSQLAMH